MILKFVSGQTLASHQTAFWGPYINATPYGAPQVDSMINAMGKASGQECQVSDFGKLMEQ